MVRTMVMTMSSANFRQYDSRWGSRNYNGSSTMAQAGCGPTSLADILYNIDTKITPWTVAKWLKANGYAVYGQGTAWSGIPSAMRHFGMTSVHGLTGMPDIFDAIAKGYKAIFLMRAGTRGGVTWTTAGHFIAVTAYKHQNGKHYFWTRDPGGRRNDGWHCYEDTMKGLIAQVWVGKVPNMKTTPVKKKTKADKIVEMARKCAWPKGTPKSKYKYPGGKRRKAYKEALKCYNRSSWGKQTRAGASCDVFVGAVLRASGVDTKFPRGLDEQIPYLKKSRKWKRVSRKNRRKGDVMIRNNKHIMIEMGGGKVANAHYIKKTYPIIEKASKEVYGKVKVYRPK